MWSCAATDTAHAQRSYLTVVRLAFTEWSVPLKQGIKTINAGFI